MCMTAYTAVSALYGPYRAVYMVVTALCRRPVHGHGHGPCTRPCTWPVHSRLHYPYTRVPCVGRVHVHAYRPCTRLVIHSVHAVYTDSVQVYTAVDMASVHGPYTLVYTAARPCARPLQEGVAAVYTKYNN